MRYRVDIDSEPRQEGWFILYLYLLLSPPPEDLGELGSRGSGEFGPLGMPLLNLSRDPEGTGTGNGQTGSLVSDNFSFLPCGEHINYLKGVISLCASLIEPGLET